MDTAREWQNRPLKKFYTFLFVDCLYVNRNGYSRKTMKTQLGEMDIQVPRDRR